MEEKGKTVPVYKRYTDYSIDMYSQGELPPVNVLLRGRALLNPEKAEMLFSENPPRGKRSVEVGRSAHSRYVRRPDGDYTVTIRFHPSEKMIREQLISEVRDIVTMVGKDYEKIKAKKEEERKEEK